MRSVLVRVVAVSVQFINGLDEEISGISLRKRRDSSTKIVVLFFERLQAIEKLRSFTNGVDSLRLSDEEGEIQVFPTGIKFIFVDDDTLSKVECSFEVDSESAWERVMRFRDRSWNIFQDSTRHTPVVESVSIVGIKAIA